MVNIRDAESSEREAIREITLAAYAQYAEVMRPRHWQAYRRHIVATLDDVGAAEQLVATLDTAESNGAVVGTVLLYPPGESFGDEVEASMDEHCPEIRLLAVSPAGRGQGVGRTLVDACIARVRSRGAPGIVLHTMPMMEAARRIYDRVGFARASDLDFQPARDWVVEGFRLRLD